jgi:hypothetical protein
MDAEAVHRSHGEAMLQHPGEAVLRMDARAMLRSHGEAMHRSHGGAVHRTDGPSRREVIAGAGAAVATALSAARTPAAADLAPPAPSVAYATGFVFEDRSGTRQPNSPGIADVMISNGRDVVLTDAAGRWTLPVMSGDSVFVIKPRNWVTPAGAGGVPRFAHLHQPEGTPPGLGLRFPGVAPAGPLPPSIDFPLRRCEEPERFDVLLFADTQPGNAAELGYVRDDIVASVLGTEAAFGIHHGDAMADDLSLLPRYLDILGTTGIPWHHCPGNHDLNLDSTDPRFAFETWKRTFGPTHYAFQYAGATFILLNNVEPLAPGDAPQGGRRYRGRIGETQLRFVENVLRHVPEDRLVAVSMHIPLVSFNDPASAADTTADRRALLALLARRPHTVSFAGHSHTTEHHYLGADAGFGRAEPHHHHVLTAASGSWWGGPRDHRGIPLAESRDGSPKGFHVLSVDGNRYTTRFVASGPSQGAQMRIMLHSGQSADQAAGLCCCPLTRAALPSLKIAADVFDGGPRTQVMCEIEGAGLAPVAMQRATMPDPFIVDTFAKNRALHKPWVAAAPSSHLWTAPLAAELPPGAYRLVVRATGEYGGEHVAHMVLEITA